MYSTCLFCRRPLGENGDLEHLPVGRRVAFDPERGRLWVVCRRCGRWNLVPIERRWEAVEECERRFGEARLRFSTGHVGLVRLPRGAELVRVGRSGPGELAAWRYGSRLRRRWLRATAAAGAAGVAGSALVLGSAAVGGVVAGAFVSVWIGTLFFVDDPVLPRGLKLRVGGESLNLSPVDVEMARMVPPFRGAPWHLHIPLLPPLAGHDAAAALRPILARLNRAGAPPNVVDEALRLLASQREPYPARFARQHGTISKAPRAARLALEMAVNEESESAALRGELAELEADWREAEETAAIADRLAVPASVEGALRRLRSGRRTR